VRPTSLKYSIKLGRQQALEAGKQMKECGITRILCSPMIRTVQTADIIAQELGLGPNSLCVEFGLVEEAKSFRGKTSTEPRPNWNPLVLPLSELTKYSSRINLDYKSLIEVTHVKDENAPNTVREHHETVTDRDEITRDRSKRFLNKLLDSAEEFENDIILCVGHGATTKAISNLFQAELPMEEHISGDKCVSCFGQFSPVDANHLHGPWKSVTGFWGSGNIPDEAKGAEDITDSGLSCRA